MDLHFIAWKIARTKVSDEHTGYSYNLIKYISDEMKETMGISPQSKPYEEGINSVVYDNGSGNIVVFSTDKITKKVAENITESLETILPRIYGVQIFTSWDQETEIVGVEMEKLKLLDSDEKMIWKAWQNDFELEQLDLTHRDLGVEMEHVDLETRLRGSKMNRAELIHFEKVQEYMVKAMMDLAEKSKNLKIFHDDLHAENIAWGHDKNLKFIDLASIDLSKHELAPQSVR